MHTYTLVPQGGLKLGLGCSRLGSVNGASPREARALLHAALEEGVRVFDTANVYGQGDSEKAIGAAIAGHDDCVLISKAGKYHQLRRRMLGPLKGTMRSTVRRSVGARHQLSAARSTPLPARWDARHLVRSLEGTLRRLRREQVEVFMLHSPNVEVILNGEAVSALDSARAAGKIGCIGVSVDDVETALAALTDDRVGALQVPLHPGSASYDATLARANAAGVTIVGREIFGGVGALSSRNDAESFARHRIVEVVGDPRIDLPLVGTTRLASLRASTRAARDAGLNFL
ncbi:aldo/keto reductase [Sinomonas soli]